MWNLTFLILIALVGSRAEIQERAVAVTDSPLDIQSEETPQTNMEIVEEHPQPVNKEEIPPQTLDPEISLEPEPALPENLDPEVLDILGSNPAANSKYGPDINKDLAIRLEHIATQGLNKESLKEIIERHPIPRNCELIGAPILNAEIKAAITDNVVKRDKIIENRQNQLATAIAGLARFLSKELENNNKNKENLKHLMDICRILCNIQHAESITRRNFNTFYMKKDIKEHLCNAKIDKYLFGENLTDTIRSARAVTKSSTELKPKTQPRPHGPRTLPPSNNLNWRSPAQHASSRHHSEVEKLHTRRRRDPQRDTIPA